MPKGEGKCDNCEKPFPVNASGEVMFYEFVDALGIGKNFCLCEECFQKVPVRA